MPLLLALVGILSVGTLPTRGAYQLRASGSPGAWTVAESAGSPSAVCWYWEGSGEIPLEGIRLRRRVSLWGTGGSPQSVGMRPLLQQRVAGTWRTVARGTLRTAAATITTPAFLPRLTVRAPAGGGDGPYRLALDLLWYAPDARVAGERRVVVGWYLRGDGSAAHSCPAMVMGDPI